MLEFDAATTRLLDTCYRGADITRRRQASIDRLRPSPGDVIVDIGCGNGLLTEEVARAVGSRGQVIGVDPSVDMRTSAEERCRDLDSVRIVDGTASALPLEDGTVHKAVSVQVFEYLPDVPGALEEAFRVLSPGGRLVIGDMHFGTLVWFSDDPVRMAETLQVWDAHAVTPSLPARLPGLLRNAGFIVEGVDPNTVVDTELRPGWACVHDDAIDRKLCSDPRGRFQGAGGGLGSRTGCLGARRAVFLFYHPFRDHGAKARRLNGFHARGREVKCFEPDRDQHVRPS